MATLLHRLGRFSTRRPWTVIVTWLILLVLALTAYGLWHGTLTSTVTIPGTPTSKVTDQLAAKLPHARGGSGTVVFQTQDGAAFTAAQRAQIATALHDAAKLPGVKATVDPFVTQNGIDQQHAQVKDGQAQLDAARAQLDAGAKQLAQAQAQLTAARQQAQAAGTGAAGSAAAQLDAEQAQLDAQQQALTASRTTLDQQAAKLADARKLLDLSAPIRTVSTDRSTALATVQFHANLFNVPAEVKQTFVDHLAKAQIDGVKVEFSNEIAQSMPAIGGIGEIAGLLAAAIVLLVMLGTLIAAGLPVLSALLGVGIGVTGALALSSAIDMLSVTPVLGLMLGLAVGIDYSLFILNRHRHQLRHGMEVRESIAIATGTSGSAVLFAGTTVVIALLALNVTGIPFLGLMGTVAAVCVAVAILIALTFTPALLTLIGTRLLPRRIRRDLGAVRHAPVPDRPMSTGRAIVSLVLGVAVLAVVALPALDMRLGLPDGATEPTGSTQYRAFKTIEHQFGAGFNGPLLVTADIPGGTKQADLISTERTIGAKLGAIDNVHAVAPIGASTDGDLIAFQVVPDTGPTAAQTGQLVRDIRDASPLQGGVKLGVAGNASGNIDISEKLAAALPVYLAIVVGLSFLILMVAFRSLLVPLIAAGGFIMSVLAAFGGVTAIFQWGWLSSLFGTHDPGPVLSFLPILLTGILFGLAMDYQLFLVSGMREAYVLGSSPRLAVARGFRAGRSVVAAAAIIMISVFAGFMVTSSVMIQSIGFGLAFGVLIDAFIVRMLLVPAAMHLLGDAAWWLPKWLDRIVPNIDVEGARLMATLESTDAAAQSRQDPERKSGQSESDQSESDQSESSASE
ncbi:MAG: MMPL family transporter [Pseudoclavibacter sp.]